VQIKELYPDVAHQYQYPSILYVLSHSPVLLPSLHPKQQNKNSNLALHKHKTRSNAALLKLKEILNK
jgi:hypothetical protein